MAYDSGNRWTARAAIPQVGIDVGLRQFMLRVYNYMAGGLAITGVIAFLSQGIYAQYIAHTPLQWVVLLAPLALVFVMGAGLQRMSLGALQASFWGYSALMGLWFASVFLFFTTESIARVFFITAGTFAAMSLYGYTTRTDLSRFGSFLMMGLIGIIIAGLVNLFIGSSAIQFAISVIGIFVFVGLTAYDTQRIKEMYFEGDGEVIAGKKAIMGALQLYLDFINLFLLLLQFFGARRD
jgi:uncharacterized protein